MDDGKFNECFTTGGRPLVVLGQPTIAVEPAERPFHDPTLGLQEKNGLGRLEKSLTAAKLNGWLANLKSQKARVELPKFRITSRLDLAEVLSAIPFA